jgi:hypothetical protein
LRTIKKDVGKVQKDVEKVQRDVTDMRTEMREGFESLETKISVVYVFVSFTDSGLTSTHSDYNSLAVTRNTYKANWQACEHEVLALWIFCSVGAVVPATIVTYRLGVALILA